MRKQVAHWSEQSTADFLYRIASDFVVQIEAKMESKRLSKSRLAQALGVSKGRVSQLLNNPGNLGLVTIVRCARALGLKVAIVAYDDADRDNTKGPIISDVFRICWENAGKPQDFWALESKRADRETAVNAENLSARNQRYQIRAFVFRRGTGGRFAEWEYPTMAENATSAANVA
ncbi:MAG: XRE family transcriptional regulator [Acidobacteria bacterium]|nr:XRE family transcriptional regulator [Acidobacteriota bacterium]